MGGPMAGHLQRAIGPIIVWNRTAAKAEPLREAGAQVAGSPEDLAGQCDTIFTCVNRSQDVRECIDRMAPSAKPGTLFVDHSTIAPNAAIALYEELKTQGLRFVDAPITGGSVGAKNGQLTIFCGGDEPDVAEAIEAFKPYAKRAERVGGPGAGQHMKMANQIAVAGSLLALCECLSFAVKAGLDQKQALDMIGGGAGGSWSFQSYGPKILVRDWTPGFSIKNQRKDLAYCKEDAEAIGAAIPGTLLVDRLLAKLDSAGRGEETTVALFEAMMEMQAEG